MGTRKRPAGELALERGDNLGHGLRRTGGGGDDVAGGGTRPAQVLVGQIEDALVVGVGVHGGHLTGNDPEEAFHDEGYRSKAVRGARGVGNDMVLGRIVVVVVYAHDDGEILFLRRGCNDDFLGAVLDVDMGLFGGTENTRGFDHHVDAIGSPGEELGIAFREAMDLPVAHGGIVAFHHGVKIGTAVVRIVFEQMEVGFTHRRGR